jgi:hypothetical protein
MVRRFLGTKNGDDLMDYTFEMGTAQTAYGAKTEVEYKNRLQQSQRFK